MYRQSKQIDYLAVSLDKTPDRIIGEKYRELDTVPNKNYNKGYETDYGAIVMWSDKNPNVRTHIIMSGKTLSVMRGEGHSDIDIAKFFMGIDCKISRVDICVTSERVGGKHHDLNPTRIHRLANDGKSLVSNLKPDKGVINSKDIETAYIGSRIARNRLFKAYDKGIDLGLQGRNLIRYELETRKRANLVLNAIAQGEDIGGIIRRYVDFPRIALWVEIMESDPVRMPHIEQIETPQDRIKNKRANRWHWLLTSVAPALANALYEDGVTIEENENLRLFGLRVQQLHEQLLEEGENE